MSKVFAVLVTKNRPQWRSWAGWNIRKQTRRPDHVVVVDSSESMDRAVWEWLLADVPHTICCGDPSWVVGRAREEARRVYEDLSTDPEDTLFWFDDDDWAHSRRIEVLEPMAKAHGAVVVVISHFLDLRTGDFWFIEGSLFGKSSLPNMAFRMDRVRGIPFPETRIAEDKEWTNAVMARIGRKDPAVLDCRSAYGSDISAIIIGHGENTWNTEGSLLSYPTIRLALEYNRLEFGPVRFVEGMTKEEWAETYDRLSAFSLNRASVELSNIRCTA